jgi:hypothetical protein
MPKILLPSTHRFSDLSIPVESSRTKVLLFFQRGANLTKYPNWSSYTLAIVIFWVRCISMFDDHYLNWLAISHRVPSFHHGSWKGEKSQFRM